MFGAIFVYGALVALGAVLLSVRLDGLLRRGTAEEPGAQL